jgi:hypothetical protein
MFKVGLHKAYIAASFGLDCSGNRLTFSYIAPAGYLAYRTGFGQL